ncbi:MAG: helix-turn-helix transcriptional regulator [Bacilli bacterium]|nr:helix-turn-helix transcriptional regulator [Bacilli bacterium]
MDLGSKIKNIRYNHNLSQEELAKKLEINRNYLSRIETNKSLPTAEILSKLAHSFNISIDNLLGINLDGHDGADIRKEKIKKINQYCISLSNKDLDFVLKMLCVMTNNSKK